MRSPLRLLLALLALLLTIYACQKTDRSPRIDQVEKPNIPVKEIQVLYSHVDNLLSEKMTELGYGNISPDYSNIVYKNMPADHQVAYVPLFKNAQTGAFIQLIIIKKNKNFTTVVTVIRPDADWYKAGTDYTKLTGQISYYASNGLFIKKYRLTDGLIDEPDKNNNLSISELQTQSPGVKIGSPLILSNDIAPVSNAISPSLTSMSDPTCNKCHTGNPCDGHWGEFGCKELPPVVLPPTPKAPPVVIPPGGPSIPIFPGPGPVIPVPPPPPPPNIPCEQAAEAAKKLTTSYNQQPLQDALKAIGDLKGLQVEKGFALMEEVRVDPYDPGIVTHDHYYTGDIYTGTGTDIKFPVPISNTKALVGIVHTHPDTGYSAPSPPDIYTVIESRGLNFGPFTANSFQGNFVVAENGSVYAMKVTDPVLANQFYNTKGNNLDGRDWNTTTEIGMAFIESKRFYEKKFKKSNEKDNLVFEESMAVVLDMFNTGVILMKQDPVTGEFKPLMRKATKTKDKKGRDVTTYSNPC